MKQKISLYAKLNDKGNLADMLTSMTFSIPEILSLIGVVQCVYLIVHILFRQSVIKKGTLPLLYLTLLACGFFLDFAKGSIGDGFEKYPYLQWLVWFSGPPLSVLLLLQLLQSSKKLELKHYSILMILPFCYMLSSLSLKQTCHADIFCPELYSLLNVTGIVAGAISLLMIFSGKNAIAKIRKQKYGKERYWLSLALIVTNICFLSVMLMMASNFIAETQVIALRTIFGLGFVYLVSTSFLRMYPQKDKSKTHKTTPLSEEENLIADKVENLLLRDKIYQEPGYSRGDLALECETNESIISKVVNARFSTSVPQLMNDHRVQDAKRLLRETNAPIKIIGEDVGFNSLPTFNRVFKDVEGVSPSAYRKNNAN